MSTSAISSKDDLLALQDVLQASRQSGATISDLTASFEKALAQVASSEGSTTAGSATGSSGTTGSLTQSFNSAATISSSSSRSVTVAANAGALQDVANAAGLSTQDALNQYSSGELTIASTTSGGVSTDFGSGAVGMTYDPLSKTWITQGQLVDGNFAEAHQLMSQLDAELPGTAAGQSVSYAQMVAYQKAGYFPNAQGTWTPDGK